MNISWPVFFLICGILFAIMLVLFWHPKLPWTPMRTPADWEPSHPVFHDDDRYWYADLWYNNPDDSDLFVPKRFGFGWTLNFGHPQAKWFLITLLGLLFLLGVGLPLIVTIFGSGSMHPSGCHTFGCRP
ncbi:DUF5808 domain-containing protein [Dictyobacter halimunensis]|uniref:DUF5808 domain-containing protein n=1 Tax=Dictyobacter halimunensis TaxID=3026934 RepID=UPI0030C77F30